MQMEVYRDHGEEELWTTGAEDGAEEKDLKNSKCTSDVFGVSKCDMKLCFFSIDSISVKINGGVWSSTSHSKPFIHLTLRYVFKED